MLPEQRAGRFAAAGAGCLCPGPAAAAHSPARADPRRTSAEPRSECSADRPIHIVRCRELRPRLGSVGTASLTSLVGPGSVSLGGSLAYGILYSGGGKGCVPGLNFLLTSLFPVSFPAGF